jgi:adenosyl cobinamide kinase/adenosyl cobinamide phosphate guanylyltransferase
MTLVVLVGGARSGKSALAVDLGRRWAGSVTFVATGEPRDEEMRERIERHRRARPSDWRLVEEPRALAPLPVWRGNDLVILDCLTLWVANLLEAEHDEETIVGASRELAALALARSAPTVVVSNEVGLGVVPATPLGRQFQDLLGAVNRVFAERAAQTLFVVAGRALRLEPVSVEEILHA